MPIHTFVCYHFILPVNNDISSERSKYVVGYAVAVWIVLAIGNFQNYAKLGDTFLLNCAQTRQWN